MAQPVVGDASARVVLVSPESESAPSIEGRRLRDSTDPPLLTPGMARIRLDPAGRLQQLRVVSPDLPSSSGPSAELDWTPLFKAAGQQPHEWTTAEPLWAPPVASDVRAAWTRDALRIEAAAFRGRPVWFLSCRRGGPRAVLRRRSRRRHSSCRNC